MKRFEYKIVDADIEPLNQLNQMGQEGWEFICFGSSVSGRVGWFKREIEPEPIQMSVEEAMAKPALEPVGDLEFDHLTLCKASPQFGKACINMVEAGWFHDPVQDDPHFLRLLRPKNYKPPFKTQNDPVPVAVYGPEGDRSFAQVEPKPPAPGIPSMGPYEYYHLGTGTPGGNELLAKGWELDPRQDHPDYTIYRRLKTAAGIANKPKQIEFPAATILPMTSGWYDIRTCGGDEVRGVYFNPHTQEWFKGAYGVLGRGRDMLLPWSEPAKLFSWEAV